MSGRWNWDAALEGARADAAQRAAALARPPAAIELSPECVAAGMRHHRRIGRLHDSKKLQNYYERATADVGVNKDATMTGTAQNIITLPVQTRLPMPANAPARGITPAQWRVLCETTFPNAKTAEAIEMAVDYCAVRKLDIFKRPINIVPMWNSALQREVETIWPGINEIQITAARTGAWAGMDAPKWGPEKTRTFKGKKKDRTGWYDAAVTVTYPEWCEVTVHRMIAGQPRAFTERVYWLEAYATTGGRDSELPNDMWAKRVHGQLHKVTKAAALRAAFPEEGSYTAEEMEGKVIEAGGSVIEGEAVEVSLSAPKAEPKPEAVAGPSGPAAAQGERPLYVNLPGGGRQEFRRSKAGLKAALDFMEREVAPLVMNNLALLDMAAEKFPDLADRIAELRAAAAEALTPEPESDAPEERISTAYDAATGEVLEPDPVTQKVAERRGAAPPEDDLSADSASLGMRERPIPF